MTGLNRHDRGIPQGKRLEMDLRHREELVERQQQRLVVREGRHHGRGAVLDIQPDNRVHVRGVPARATLWGALGVPERELGGRGLRAGDQEQAGHQQ